MTETMVTVQTGMQYNFQQVQDDLAHLFSRNMTFSPNAHVSRSKEIYKQEPTLHLPASDCQPIIYSVSQHYNHSAHIARSSAQQSQEQVQTQSQRRSSEPPQTELSPVEDILRNHGLDPAILTPSQLQLFRVADDAQKLRLLELWSIFPPHKAEEIPALAWSSTSVDQEEQMARLRYERHQNITMSLDGTSVQAAGGQWTQQNEVPHSEPYMSSGYEELMRREHERQSNEHKSRDVYTPFGSAVGGCHSSKATDPVYRGCFPTGQQQQQRQLEMSSHYGAATMDMDVMEF
ncbi:hypothetical protein E4U21_006270 [Claviceps maximensis]|nr:hypothetical protein E4U21_006270 [Claviceps maximensis]